MTLVFGPKCHYFLANPAGRVGVERPPDDKRETLVIGEGEVLVGRGETGEDEGVDEGLWGV